MQAGGGGGGGSRSGGRRDDEAVRKGPWLAEEDEVLLEYVSAHGPRDWSSIRSKGLLPRTGKSCRLRWVNKLRPDLKTGCKFTAKEERVVIELQAQFGNKWARIATYLPGRTDNDVKNFWSTRQKRLARLLGTPLSARPIKNCNAAPPASSHHHSQPPEGPCLDLTPLEGSFSNGQCSTDLHNAAPMPPLTCSDFLNFEAILPHLAPAADGEASSSNAAPMVPQPQFEQLPYPLFDFPGLPECCCDVVGPGFVDIGSMDDLTYQEPLARMQPVAMPPFLGIGNLPNGVKTEPRDAPDIFFDDLPPDMFDSLDEQPPPPPPPLPPPPPPPPLATSSTNCSKSAD